MPNIGRPSGACYSCKRMKVRCGEERPSCRRCLDANRHCPGYGPAPDVFRHAKVADKGRSTTCRTYHATTATQDPASDAITTTRPLGRFLSDAHDIDSDATPTRSSLEKLVSTDWVAYGVNMFIYHYTVPDEDKVYRGHMAALPDFYSANSGVNYLHHAMLSVSLALLAHHAANDDLIRQARQHRSQAITELRYALLDKREARSDQVLLALFLLERFELLSGENQSAKVWYNHSEGMSTLLRLRGSDQFATPIGRELFRWINLQLTIKDQSYGSSLAYPGAATDAIRTDTIDRQQYAMKLMGALLRRLKAVQEQESLTSERATVMINAILSTARDLHAYLVCWRPYVPKPRTLTSSTAAKSPSQSPSAGGNVFGKASPLYYFHSFPEGSAFGFYHVMWIRWARFVIDCHRTALKFTSSSPSPGAATSTASLPPTLPSEILPQLSYAADQLALAIPFMTCELPLETSEDGFLSPHGDLLRASRTPPRGCAYGCWASIWHLNNIIGTPELDISRPGLREWALERHLDLKYRVGIKQAGAFHDLFRARMSKGLMLRNYFKFDQEQGEQHVHRQEFSR